MTFLKILTFLIAVQMKVAELMELRVYIATKQVMYGKDLSFICSSDIKDTSLWYWFKNDSILFTSGLPGNKVDTQKYTEYKVTENIRKLTITDLEFSDIQNYKCFHAFQKAWLNLPSEANNFVYVGNSTSIKTRLHDNKIIVDVINVSPVPTCNLILKNGSLPMREETRTKAAYLYNVSFQQIMQCNNGEIITKVQCDVGGFNLNNEVNLSCSLSGKTILLQNETYDRNIGSFYDVDNSTSIKTRLHDNKIIVDVINVSLVPTCNLTVQNGSLPMTEETRTKAANLYNVSFQQIMQCNNGDIITKVQCDVGGFNLNNEVNLSCSLTGKTILLQNETYDRNIGSFYDDKTYQEIFAIGTISVALIAVVIIATLVSLVFLVLHLKKQPLSSEHTDSDVDHNTQREPFL